MERRPAGSMTRGRHLVVGLMGAVAIVLTLVGLFVIEARPGPIERPLVPYDHEIFAEGIYTTRAASGDTGPGGACLPEPPATTCTQAETQVRLRLSGLPDAGDGAYHGFIADASGWRHLGPLDPDGDDHVLDTTESYDGREDRRLLVSLEPHVAPREPGPIVVYRQDLLAAQDLSGGHSMHLVEAEGEVRLNQIGAVEMSATAKATIASPVPLTGWRLHAWFLDANGAAVDLGPFEDEGTHAVLDVRAERVGLADQTRFIVTLEPLGTDPEAPSRRLVHDVPL